MTELPNYIIMDPTGNITALVTEPVASYERIKTANAVLLKEPAAEQLGFLSGAADADIALDMAGGEFCGNAAMCAAAYYAHNNSISNGKVRVRVSGCSEPVEVEISLNEDGSFCGIVDMPAPLSIEIVEFSDHNRLPVVHFQGADHIIWPSSTHQIPEKETLERLIKKYSAQMHSLCTGIMIFDEEKMILTPLVYVPGADTLFWEHSCASGTAALGAWKAWTDSEPAELKLHEPGGILTVRAYPEVSVYLQGNVKF